MERRGCKIMEMLTSLKLRPDPISQQVSQCEDDDIHDLQFYLENDTAPANTDSAKTMVDSYTAQLTRGERVFIIDELEASLYLLRRGSASQGAGTPKKKPPKEETAVPPPLQRLRYSREEPAVQLSISPRQLDYAIEHRRIRVTHDGARVHISRSELIRYAKEDHPTWVRESPDEAA